MTRQAWVTLATNDTYALGALVLVHSLRRVNTAHETVVLITPGVTPAMREQLTSVFNVVQEVDIMDSGDAANLALLSRPDLGITFTKLHCWRLTQFSKCVFLDADTMVIENCDELFEREELSAAPDAGWPDCFNSGVFVYTPSNETYTALVEFALSHGSFDGGDQGLLNMFFKDWATKDINKHLPFIYNMCSTSTYTYLPAFKFFGDKVKIVHFIGGSKPWLQAGSGSSISTFVQSWWDVFQNKVSSHLSSEMGGLAGAFGRGETSGVDDHWHKQSWEQGNIDYMGRDSFDNIWKKIEETLSIAEEPAVDDSTSGQQEMALAVRPELPVVVRPELPVVLRPEVPVAAVPPPVPAPVSVEPIPLPAPTEPEPSVPTPAPVEPISAEPAPIEPIPAPAVPAPVKPTSVVPAPVEPTPVVLAPVVPTPVEPIPAVPAPVEPTPVVPAPVASTPVVPAPAPIKPIPAAPQTPTEEKGGKAKPKLVTQQKAEGAAAQPGTPTVTSPTPPISPEPQTPPLSASSSTEHPVPPKRKSSKGPAPDKKGKGKK